MESGVGLAFLKSKIQIKINQIKNQKLIQKKIRILNNNFKKKIK